MSAFQSGPMRLDLLATWESCLACLCPLKFWLCFKLCIFDYW